MKQDQTISQAEAIHRIAAQMDKPMNLDDFINRVLEIWPSRAKNPQASVRQTIRDDHLGKDLLFLDEKTLITMQQAMAGIRFRIPLTRAGNQSRLVVRLPSIPVHETTRGDC